jgi:branched-chain amino acid transport system ATP-binding protein
MPNILEVNDLVYSYGKIRALKGITLHIEEGEIIALIGANGAGKTTTLHCISGLLGQCESGTVTFRGKRLNGMRAHEVSQSGITQVLEGRHIFPHLTIKENLMMGAYLRTDTNGINSDLADMYRRFPRLHEREKQLGGTLSGGEQQMLAIARALMARPKLILMDEPSLGLAPLIVREVFQIIRKINREGIPILLVEQNSKAALSIADRGYVLESGEIVMCEKCEDLLNSEKVQKSYLGG